jgi:hypothetical protein
MAYQTTEVPVARSQEGIKKLLRAHGGFSFAAVSQDDPTGDTAGIEGFEAQILLENEPYRIRIMATVPKVPKARGRLWRGSMDLTDRQVAEHRDRAEKRLWRVLYYHMKAMFEAADTGVLEFRELLLPYIVVPKTNLTVGQQLLTGTVSQMLINTPQRMLTAGGGAS